MDRQRDGQTDRKREDLADVSIAATTPAINTTTNITTTATYTRELVRGGRGVEDLVDVSVDALASTTTTTVTDMRELLGVGRGVTDLTDVSVAALSTTTTTTTTTTTVTYGILES